MPSILTSLNSVLRQKDLLLVVVFVMILLMMILPLPTFLMDLLITLNISAGIIILLMSLHLHLPIQFSTFPSVLLVTTLFRLAISISTTRLILIDGDAGKIVETFGKVVVSGNLIVGMVIFMIITVVQFLVITKGADRVAEVGARFTLDGMPGKQMAVDADVRAGSMDQFDAKIARGNLEREAKLFGAMDGAMKFVKGDAVAGLVITVINLLGGIGIGMGQLGMEFSEALQLYALLTVGDGLVAQIPALLISVAAGTLVTRVTNPVGIDLGTEISEQVIGNTRTVMSAGFVIAAFGFIPGFPTLIFMAVGLAMAGSVYFHLRKQNLDDIKAIDDWGAMQDKHRARWQDLKMRTGQLETVKVKLPAAMLETSPYVFKETFDTLRNNVGNNFGVLPGYWTYEINEYDPENYQIYIKQELVAEGSVRSDCVFVKANVSYLDALDIPHIEHFGTEEGALVHVDHIATLNQEGIHSANINEQILHHILSAISSNLDMFVGFQKTSEMLDDLSASNPALSAELRNNLSINQISAVLQLLLQERIPVTSNVRIFEAISEFAPKRSDPQFLLQKVRVSISDFISKRYARDNFLPVIVIAPSLESLIREGFRTSGEDTFLILQPTIMNSIIEQIKKVSGAWHRRDVDPVIIAQQDIRRAVHNVLHKSGVFMPVLAYQELTAETIIYPIGFIAGEDKNQLD